MTEAELLALIDRAAEEGWTELDLSGQNLTALPSEIGKLTQLESLILGKVEEWRWVKDKFLPKLVTNQLTVLPPQLTALTRLRTLELSGNPLVCIPDVVFQLQQLEALTLVSTGLIKIPEVLGQLTNLTLLDLGSNQISEIPEVLGQLTNLALLDLRINQISKIPEVLVQLPNFEGLSIAGNQISEIPEVLGQLTNLTKLYLSRNQISEIPEVLGQLTDFAVLNLGGNQITQIPEVLGQLTNLTVLSLWGNQITQIPEVLGQLTNLTKLDLSNNQITQIPDVLGSLTNLTELDLSSNQITQIPEVLGQLTNLTVLSLWGNQITQIPDVLGSLTNLTVLDLSSNQITQIPDVLGSLTNLTGLDLSINQITQIPDVLGSLTNLTGLSLSINQITKLPKTLSNLTQLEKLDLRGNPINIPPDLLVPKEGEYRPDAQPILDYYFRIQDPNQNTTLYEAKILIVGEGGAGKTSLARKLLDPDYELPAETEDRSTQGIDILKWEFTGRNQQTYRVKLWDFGGQEIYHQTHQFFLTERSLYLLVADNRKQDIDHYYWLQIIRLLSNDSPVLLIQNEKQNRTCTLDLRQLRAEFASLRPPLSLNLADNRGLAETRRAIQHSLEDLLPDGIPFPNPWINVRYSLENDGRNYIDCAEYEAICRHHGITKREEMFTLSRFLHSLGICLHFQDDPILRHRLILKPNWGTTAVYKILDNPTVTQQLGQFNSDNLRQIWQDSQYADMRSELLQLMKEFKVCYEIPRRPGEYIAPHLLSPNPPDYDWDDGQENDQQNNRHNLILRYRYRGFMPKGILTRFIVEMHKLIENVSQPDSALVWKTGVVLTQDNARSEITERYHDREIHIRLGGLNQRNFLVIINSEFRKIHDSYERLEYDTLIPCNCTTCKPSPNPFAFPYDRLQQCLNQRRYTIECHESGEDVNVRRLLDDTIDPGFDRKRQDTDEYWLSREEMYAREHSISLIERSKLHQQPTNSGISFNPVINVNANSTAMTEPTSKTNNFNGPMSGVIGSDNAQVSNNQFIQTNDNTAELLQLVAKLRQNVAHFPPEQQEEITIDIEDLEAEIQKPAEQRNPTRLKKRLLALAAAAAAIATPIAATTDFANTALDLGSKLGIEFQLPPGR
ncbi:MAG: leucine-rich repeat domain-containing protein [Elainella sp.]